MAAAGRRRRSSRSPLTIGVIALVIVLVAGDAVSVAALAPTEHRSSPAS